MIAGGAILDSLNWKTPPNPELLVSLLSHYLSNYNVILSNISESFYMRLTQQTK